MSSVLLEAVKRSGARERASIFFISSYVYYDHISFLSSIRQFLPKCTNMSIDTSCRNMLELEKQLIMQNLT